MIFYYICRNVKPGAKCSYPVGFNLLPNEVYRTEAMANRKADLYNHHCQVAGVRYVVVPADDTVEFVPPESGGV